MSGRLRAIEAGGVNSGGAAPGSSVAGIATCAAASSEPLLSPEELVADVMAVVSAPGLFKIVGATLLMVGATLVPGTAGAISGDAAAAGGSGAAAAVFVSTL